MIIIGLTGGIASGKSAAAEILKEKGAYIIDCDVISREVTAKGTEGAALIADAFGPTYFRCGELNRQMLRDHVHSNPYRLALLNSLVHPLIRAELKRKLSLAAGVKAVCIVAPLLFEANLDPIMDVIWTIEAEESLRIDRMLVRDNMTRDIALSVISHQMTDAERARRSGLVIKNNGTFEELRLKVAESYDKLISG